MSDISALLDLVKTRISNVANHLESQQFNDISEIIHKIDGIIGILSEIIFLDVHRELELSNCIEYLISCKNQLETVESKSNISTGLSSSSSGDLGRSRIHISKEQLEFLLSCDFTQTEIGALYGISRSTVRRRISEYGCLSERYRYSNMSDDSLDAEVNKILTQHPDIGYRSVKAHLINHGVKVQEYRVKESMLRVDIEGVLLRKLTRQPVQRRKYNVRAPNALWHIDGYHKLIR